MLDTNTILAAIEAYKADDVQAFVDTDVFETPDNLAVFMLQGVAEKNPDKHFWTKVWARRTDWIQQATIMYSMTADNKASVLSQGTMKIDGERAVLSHFPYEGDHTPTDRHEQHRPRDLGATIIHGHTHAPRPLTYSATGAIQVCVSLDAWNMRPVKKETLQNVIREAKAQRDGQEGRRD